MGLLSILVHGIWRATVAGCGPAETVVWVGVACAGGDMVALFRLSGALGLTGQWRGLAGWFGKWRC